MTTQEARKTIDKIFKKNDSVEIGIFISLLAKEYLRQYNVSEKKFFLSLKNSLKILKDSEKAKKKN